jgi:serine/threonine protein kinase
MTPKTNGPPAKIIDYLAIRPLLVNVKSHGDTAEQLRERKVAHCEPFMPNKDLESFVTEKNVEATLDELLGHDEYNKDLTDYIVKKAPRTFLTCIYIGAEYLKRQACIEILRKADFTDTNLPIRTAMVKDAKDGDEPYEVCATGSDDPLACFSKWGARLQAEYEEKQWIFLAPTFKECVFSYEFHQNEQMPFVYLPNPNPAGGFFGKVLKLGLHEDHQSLRSFHLKRKPNARYAEVAVKFMSTESNVPNSDVDKFYDREKTTLELMRKLKDDHLIRAIAAYKKGTSRCFIFPWAEGGNLDTFWRNDRSGLDEYLVRWAINQMTGITGGIMKLHAKGTRHGDIKPFNILYFLDEVDDHGRGTLKIADVGLAKVHTEYTKYRDPTTTRMSTERYEPPEMMRYIKREAAIPRVYDSWSLGCVFLEFTVWLLYGQTKLNDFHRDLKDSNQEKFYELKGNSHPRHHVVNKLIKEMEESFSDSVTFGRLIQLISEHLLVPVHKRMETRILYEEMDDIRRNSQQDSYSGLAGLPRLRPVPNDGPQPPDKVSVPIYKIDPS